ncbi:MAG: hypothetical protein COW30_09540 [Rhodospirillales bacterium CG15_BIG_FIL_POST_REV_8_21_14_020_66_15]|nr:MAG: hypothetical protein COW30_09540 [Rhodospirillales bacterium CG15_BIG_FIL_POST_REV_8_21_14_020_66_15]
MRFLSALLVVAALALPVHAADAPEPVHGLAMHGDLKYRPDFKHFDYVNPDAPKGGTVRLGSIGSFDSFNPFIVKGSSATGAGFVYDTLMDDAADEPFSQYGRLAEKVTMPKDRSWVEFTLRKEARWHDGMPVTVEDVIFSFNTLVKEGAPFYRFYYGNVADVTQTGERSVRFTFKPGENRELPLILGQLTVLPKHYWSGREFNKATLEPPLGSGPYKITEFEAGRFVKLTRVKDYWGKDIPVMKGYNNFDEIIFDYYRDANVSLEAFLAGRYDYRLENSSKAWATAYETPAVKKGVLVKAEIQHDRPAGMQGFAFNTRRELFRDRKVRHALAYAFNFEWSNKALFYGQYERTRSYFQNSEMAATGLPGPDELKLLEPFRDELPPEVFTQEYNPPKGSEDGNIRANLRTASKLLTEAGWVIKNGRRVNAETGRPFAFEMLLVSPLFERIALPFAKNLEKLGIAMTVRTIDTAQYRRRLDTFDFDMVVGGFGQSLSPGNEQRDFWSSDSADREGARNIIGIKSKAVDAIVEKLIAAPSRDALVTASKALDRVLQWGHYMIPNWHAPYDRVAYWDKFGRPKVTPTRGTQFFAWWIDPAKAQSLPDRKRGL